MQPLNVSNKIFNSARLGTTGHSFEPALFTVSFTIALLEALKRGRESSGSAGLLIRWVWLRGLDLNQRPLGYEIDPLRLSNSFCGTHSKPEECSGRFGNADHTQIEPKLI
jgi:hypothetical protein